MSPKLDILADDGTHTYWSTHCRHDDHNLCKGFCKKCGPAAPCICPCHKSGSGESAPEVAAVIADLDRTIRLLRGPGVDVEDLPEEASGA